MTKIKCAAIECKYNSNELFCTRKEIRLTECSVMTVWEGRQQYWKCSGFEESDVSARLRKFFEKAVETESHL